MTYHAKFIEEGSWCSR